ncbi:MAG: hypothetical protein V5A76_08395 [Candidatus Thermoplasmatota archaeon]
MKNNKSFKEAQKAAAKKAEELNCSCLIQSGSSLREEDFAPGSDLDLLALFDEEKEERWGHDHSDGLEISMMKESKTKFLDGLKEGDPFELMALKFGKVRRDDGFLKDLDRSKYSPTERTHEVWIRSGLNQYSKMINNNLYPIDFYNAAYHSFRSFSRTILLKEKEVIEERDKRIKEELADLDEKASDYFWSLRKDRFDIPKDDASEVFDGLKNDKTVKRVEYMGEKAMSERGKIFPSYERLEREDSRGLRMFPRDRERIDFSVLEDEGYELFEFNMETGEMKAVRK